MSITFGRYSDSYKPQPKLDYWDTCEKAFDAKKYTESYVAFMNYMKDDTTNNVTYTVDGDNMKFEIIQGSKIVNGSVANSKVIAESYIAEYEKPGVAFMRRLMEMNYTLYYSRFCLKDNKIVIKFDSSIADGSPRKLYYALKEVATRADKQDDLFLEEFPMLKPTAVAPEEPLPDAEKELKYSYFSKWIGDTLKRIGELNEDAISGGISYLLLNLLYKIDYLIVPEGKLTNDLEKISWAYFARDNKPYIQKNREMKEAFKKMLDMPKEKFIGDLYRTKATFGVANPAPHQSVIDVYNNNINNVAWYVDNKYEDIAITIYEYIGTYCLFSYGMMKPNTRLFHLLVNIVNQQYFTDLGLKEVYYDIANKKLNDQLIKDTINGIIKDGQGLYPDLKFNLDSLKFDTLLNFLRTYLAEIQNLKYNN